MAEVHGRVEIVAADVDCLELRAFGKVNALELVHRHVDLLEFRTVLETEGSDGIVLKADFLQGRTASQIHFCQCEDHLALLVVAVVVVRYKRFQGAAPAQVQSAVEVVVSIDSLEVLKPAQVQDSVNGVVPAVQGGQSRHIFDAFERGYLPLLAVDFSDCGRFFLGNPAVPVSVEILHTI